MVTGDRSHIPSQFERDVHLHLTLGNSQVRHSNRSLASYVRYRKLAFGPRLTLTCLRDEYGVMIIVCPDVSAVVP